jgi:TM2 domain-containing membrane protein YozV/RNA polymerase subunit RPABC4/transcription elongation factor Spt4
MSETKYCANCGDQINKEAEICPECGVRQPNETETKYCANCGEQIDENAEICPKCGVRQPGATTSQQPVYQQKNPGIAAVLSALFVGLGQIYNGEILKGIILIIAYAVSYVLILILIGFITTPLLWIYGVYDAYNTAKKINEGTIVV